MWYGVDVTEVDWIGVGWCVLSGCVYAWSALHGMVWDWMGWHGVLRACECMGWVVWELMWRGYVWSVARAGCTDCVMFVWTDVWVRINMYGSRTYYVCMVWGLYVCMYLFNACCIYGCIWLWIVV